MAFTSTGFGSGGKSALTAFAETPGQETAAEEEDAEEEEPVTEAKVQVQLTEIKKQGQLLAGNLLEKEVQQKQEIQQDSKEELERINEQIVMEDVYKRQGPQGYPRRSRWSSYSPEDAGMPPSVSVPINQWYRPRHTLHQDPPHRR